jgi:hypothetical protein
MPFDPIRPLVGDRGLRASVQPPQNSSWPERHTATNPKAKVATAVTIIGTIRLKSGGDASAAELATSPSSHPWWLWSLSVLVHELEENVLQIESSPAE